MYLKHRVLSGLPDSMLSLYACKMRDCFLSISPLDDKVGQGVNVDYIFIVSTKQ